MSTAQIKLNLRFYGDPVLRSRSKLVSQLTDRDKSVMNEMYELMKISAGVGLAAPQVGINKQIIVVDVGQGPIKLVNPRIVKKSGSERMEEGCLSLPGVYVSVKRARSIVVNAINEDNQKIALSASGLLARVLQHEIDHLRGRMIIDYASMFAKIRMKKKLKTALENVKA